MQSHELSTARTKLEGSSTFQRSSALLALLDFLLAAAQDGLIKETWVGTKFYKREATYDPRLDSIARVNVRRLRHKLEQFYASEGVAETMRIVVPSSSFTPMLQLASGALVSLETGKEDCDVSPPVSISVLKETIPQVAEVPFPVRSVSLQRWWWALGAIVLASLALISSRSLHRATPFPQGSWRTEPLTLGRELEFGPATTPDGKRLAYVSRLPHSFQFRIFERDLLAKSTPGVQLDTGSGDAFYPVWSPDATQIAFMRCDVGPCEIATIPARGGPVRQVKSLPLYTLQDDQAYYQYRQLGPVWTSDGRSLIFPYRSPSATSERLVQQDLNTGNLSQITFGDPGDEDAGPAISRDGKRIAYLRRHLDHTDIMTLELQSGATRVLETEPSHTPSGVTWAPDGSGVIVGILRRASAPGLLYVPLAGTPRVLEVSLPGLLNPVYTGDGKGIMVLSTNRNRNIAEVTDNGSEPNYIFNSKQKNSFLALSPDKKRLAFLSSLTGMFELWICDRDGTNFSTPRQLTHGLPYYPFSVAWAPDGRTLAVGISHTNNVEMVDAQTGAFQPLQLPGLARSNVWGVAWSADGRSIFLAVKGERRGILRASTTLISGLQPVMQGDAEEIRLDAERALYFTTGNTLGIHKLSLLPGATPELIPSLATVSPARDWFIEGGKLYYLDVHDPSRRVRAYDLLSGQLTTVTQPLVRPAFLDGSLAYDSKDHLMLYSEWSEEAGSQIYMLYPSGKPLNEDEPK